jgi:cell pole-organizing protein PopZ
MRHTSEPSVEEILESIKKVIARDNRAEAARDRVRRENMADGPAPQRISAPEQVRAANKPAHPGHDVLDLSEVAAQILNAEHGYGSGYDRGSGTDMDDPEIGDGDDAPLLPETTTASMRESLAALAMMSAPGAAPQIVRSGETSLEGLVRELLRPQLAEWLDRNLPPMVEKLVATEIARIVGKKG